MTRQRQAMVMAVLCAAFSQSVPFVHHTRLLAADVGLAQDAVPAPPPPAPPLPAPPFPAQGPGDRSADATDPAPDPSAHRDDVVRVASDYTLKADDRVGDLVVVIGNATIDGHVHGDLVVVLGQAQLGPTAVVDGDMAIIGGTLRVKNGAVAHKGVIVVAGSLEAPSDFVPQGQQVIIGFKGLGDAIRGLLPWLTRGLLMGRPIVPDLPWVWAVVGVLFAVYLGVLLIFERPVRYAADTLTATPLRALATGLGTLLAAGPLVLLLAASLVGLLVVPFAACAFLVAGLVGKVATNAWLGARLVPEGDDKSRLTLARSFAVGCGVLILAYMVPVLGALVWATAGAVGLGASVLAFVSAYRRENPPVERLPFLPPPVPTLPSMPPLPDGLAEPADAWPGPGAASAPPPQSQAAAMLAMPHASFADRLAAFVLDVILVAMVILLIERLHGSAFLPLLMAYRFAFWAWKGTTVGGIICQLRLTRVDGTLVGPGEALVRTLGSIFSIGVLGLGCLWILRDADRQAWHDKMAGTFVVKVPRHWPV